MAEKKEVSRNSDIKIQDSQYQSRYNEIGDETQIQDDYDVNGISHK